MRSLCRPFLSDQAATQARLCRRIERSIEELFVFVSNPDVPPDNNTAERSLRGWASILSSTAAISSFPSTLNNYAALPTRVQAARAAGLPMGGRKSAAIVASAAITVA